MMFKAIHAVLAASLLFSLTSCVSSAQRKDGEKYAASVNAQESKPPFGSRTLMKETPDDFGLPRDAESVVVGRVEERKEAAGTLSEYTYFVIVRDDGKAIILFNDIDLSRGFDSWAGKDVEIRCRPVRGKLGFKMSPADGVKVVSIQKVE